ncbi:ribonuclease III [Candidatus Puniceispirillum sp.]|jgi:ribonuclease III|uniref:ribonuclease III n=1 Tax=Candidatus Puniceispirillum sp. TaxID=2026719 RepID=UPI001EBFEE24|nr:ribonuclease III [Candidatus Puniceispirillum sp.]
MNSVDLKPLADRLDHKFTDQSMLVRALTHASFAGPVKSNERLEFLGDRVLGLVLADFFFTHCPDENEGKLSLRLHAYARQSKLVEVGLKLDLASFISVQNGMALAENESVLADAVESLIAAHYLDGGFEVARAFIIEYWALDTAEPAGIDKDAKSSLQELVMKQGLALPTYVLVSKSGPDHAPEMTYEVSVDGYKTAVASASNRKVAEQKAAALMIAHMTKKEIK